MALLEKISTIGCVLSKKSLYCWKRTENRPLTLRRGFMNEYKNWKILQIIPAQGGWKAIHCRESGNKEIEISNRSIICWALVEAVGETAGVQTQVRGIVQQSNDLAVVEDLIRTDKLWEDGTDRNEYLLGYNDPDAHKESDYWLKQANNRLRTEKQKRLEKDNGKQPVSPAALE
jgi:hypothetical protein